MTVPGTVFFFAGYELDMAVRELRQGDHTVALQPRVLDLLHFLVTNRQRAVDKDAIQEAVWSGRIVSETALTRAIMKARRAVGDSAESQHLIRTVHGHGYQFVGEVQHPDPNIRSHTDTTDTTDTTMASAEPAAAGVQLRGLAIVVAALAVAIVAFFLLRPAPPPVGGVRIAVMPINNTTNNEEFGWASLGLMGYANDLLGAATSLGTVTPGDVVRYADASGWQGAPADRDFADHVAHLRQRYGASHVLLSELASNAGGLRLTYALIGADGLITDGTMVNPQSTELVKGMVRGVTVALTRQRRLGTPAMSIADDPFIDEAYARARSLAIEGRCAEALALYDVVIASAGERTLVTLQRATCARILGRWEEAEASFSALLDEFDGADQSAARAEALAGLGIVLHRTGRHAEAAERYDAGLAQAEAAGDRVIVGRLLVNRAILAKDQRRFDDARSDLARASVAYRDAGYDVLPGHIGSAHANIAMNDGKLDQADRYLNEAIASFRQLGDRRNEAMMLNNMGYLRRKQGRYAEALPLHQQSLAIRRDIGDRVGQGRILGMLSTLYARQREFEQSLEAAQEALAIAREAHDALFIATGLSHLGTALRHLSRYDEARQAYSESATLFDSLNDPSRAAQARLLLASVDLDMQRWQAAEEAFVAIEGHAANLQLHEPRIEALKYRGDLARLRAQNDHAIEHYKTALALIDDTGFAAGHARQLNVELANLYLDADDVYAAEPYLGTALDGPPDLGVARLQARFAFEGGNEGRAATVLETAKASSGNAWLPEDELTLARYRDPQLTDPAGQRKTLATRQDQ